MALGWETVTTPLSRLWERSPSCLLPPSWNKRELQGWKNDFPSPPTPSSLLCPVLLTQKCKGQAAWRGVKSQLWKDESFNTTPQLWSQQQNLQLESFLTGVG